MTMLAEDWDRLSRKHNRKSNRAVSTQTRSSQEKKLADVETVYQKLGRPPSAREVAAENGPSDEAYRMFDSWDDVLRAAGVPAAVDLVGGWIADSQADPSRSAQTFTARRIVERTGGKREMVGAALGRLRDGIAIELADGCQFEGEVVVRGRTGNGQHLWGVDR